MLEAGLQTSYQRVQNGIAPHSGNAGVTLQSGEAQEYFTFSQAARLMGVSRQYIYKLVKEDKLRASRISGRMSLVRRADIELMLKSKPYERLIAKSDFDISEYYTAEEIAEKYKVNAKWVWTYTRQHKVPKVKIRKHPIKYTIKNGCISFLGKQPSIVVSPSFFILFLPFVWQHL